MAIKDFLKSESGKLSSYKRRKKSEIHFYIDGVEPESKKMSHDDKIRFQKSVLKELADLGRSAFRGDIALCLSLQTTSKTPPHIHTITKNILDLLGKKHDSLKGKGNRVLYQDDSQIQALSVTCTHGEKYPLIGIRAMRLSSLISDLELATEISRGKQKNEQIFESKNELDMNAIKQYSDLIKKESELRDLYGNKRYEAMTNHYRFSAQKALLSRSELGISTLAGLYHQSKGWFNFSYAPIHGYLVKRSPARIQIGTLPTTKGSSASFKKKLEDEIDKFKDSWDWLINPLQIPASLEVVVRPSRTTPKSVLHDLDNIVRDYLIPKIVPAFKTVSDYRFLDFAKSSKLKSEIAELETSLPLNIKAGLSRYEIWRVPPPPDDEEGFVSLALVSDLNRIGGGVLDQVELEIASWERSIR